MSPMTEFLQARGLKTQDEADALLLKLAQDREVLLAALKQMVDHFGDPLKMARVAITQAERVTP